MTIIGITGTLGAGKGTIVDYLKNKLGFEHFSVRSFLIDELEKRGLPVNRDSMTELANELRAQHAPSYIVDRLYEQAKKTGKNCIIESIRTPGEIESLRKKGAFYLLAVDADPEVRYKRIQKRATETDHIDFKTFIHNEQREFSSTDPNKQNLQKCIQMADFVFSNDETIKKLENKISTIISTINKKNNGNDLGKRYCILT